MGTRGSPEKGTGKSARGGRGTATKVDPADNRPENAAEMSPESLVPDIVRTELTREPATPSPEDRQARIAARAYEIARQRGFTPGAELDDWLQAEREIDAELAKQTRPEDQFTG